MTEKKFENSILIEGNYSFNYLTNLLFLSRTCIINIFEKKSLDSKENKKLYKNIRNLCDFLNSSIDIFSKISQQENEDKVILHTIEYKENNPISVPVLENIDLSDTSAGANAYLDYINENNDLSQATVASVENIRNSFKDNKIITGLQSINKLSDEVINKNKEVDSKYDEEE